MPVHPALSVIPEFVGDGFDGLVESVRDRGLTVEITLSSDGQVLDGRARLRACALTGVQPRFRIYDGDDACGYVVGMNVIRTHLGEDQCAVIALGLSEVCDA